jgi:alpha-tubulin suppressor-like RCC1 family protein
LVLGAHTWKKITAGGDHTCGIDTSNAAWCWGSDANGELGDNGTLADKGVPTLVDASSMGQVKTISAGSDFTCAVDVTAAATGWCWGDGSVGQLGDGSIASPINFPTDVTSSNKWTFISAGESHACGIDNTSHVYCWGAGARGQIGDGVLSEVLLPGTQVGSDTYSAVAAGGDYACGISVSNPGTGWCWGYAIQSTLANGFLNQQSAPLGVLGKNVFSQVVASQIHSCALDAANAAWCWGDNSFDELGTGDETSHSVPVAVAGGHFFSQISSFSFESNCARVTGSGDQPVFCWGLNEDGELGNGTTNSAPSPVAPTGAVTTFSVISAGYSHTCAVRSAGATYCWGANVVGELGDGTTMTQQLQPHLVPGFSGTSISAGFEFTCAIETAVAHHVWCWGNNTNGQLGISGTVNATVPTVSNSVKAFSQVTTGAFHACALEQGTGNAYCWGANNKGQLGVGSFNQKTVPTLVSGAVTSFVSISAGSADPVSGSPITCASTSAGASYCWGSSYGNAPTLVTPP